MCAYAGPYLGFGWSSNFGVKANEAWKCPRYDVPQDTGDRLYFRGDMSSG